jgi:hypothetical protein
MRRTTFTDSGGTQVVAYQVVVAAEHVGGSEKFELPAEPQWSSLTDETLVLISGLAGTESVPGGWTQPHPYGFRAQAELARRQRSELANYRREATKSAGSVEKLTLKVVELTNRLFVLTAVLVGLGLVTIGVTIWAAQRSGDSPASPPTTETTAIHAPITDG